MESSSTTDIIRFLQTEQISLFSLADFGRMFKIDNRQTLYKKLQRLEKKKIVQRLVKGKYSFLLSSVSDFTIANYLYRPSYVSLETALSFYGIITGFPYQITSITIQKAKSFNIDTKEFRFSQISPNLFWGWEKKEDFLIAEPEKALLDYIYFGLKGLRSVDWDELETTGINKKILFLYAKRFNNQKILEVATDNLKL